MTNRLLQVDKWISKANIAKAQLPADNESKDASREMELRHAASNGHDFTVQMLVMSDGIDKDAADNTGMTALLHAASNGRNSTIHMLVKTLGADKGAKDTTGRMALHHAASNGHSSTVRVLVSAHGANMEAKDTSGMTALHYAASNGHRSAVWMLVSGLGANREAKDTSGMTALHYAVSKGHSSVVWMLVWPLRANKHAKDTRGMTLLHHAASNGHNSTVLLLSKTLGCDKEIKDTNGWTALYHAASNGHDSTVKLLAKDTDIEITEEVVVTSAGNDQHGRQLIELLLRNGAHAPLHRFSKDAAMYLLQNWFNELAVEEFACLKLLAEDGYSVSELAELVSQQTQFDDANDCHIQFLDSKEEFAHQELCAHSYTSKSHEENRLPDNDHQFFSHPDVFYHQQDQLQRKVAMCCGIGWSIEKTNFTSWNNKLSEQAEIVYDSKTIPNRIRNQVFKHPTRRNIF